MNTAMRMRGGMIVRIMLTMVEEEAVTNITPSDMATAFRTLLVTARDEQIPSIMRKRALFFQNPSKNTFHALD
jgi:hypothetical protein